MANTSLGTLAISMSLWAIDLGAGHLAPPSTPPSGSDSVASVATCEPGASTPTDDSDLEIVVCGSRAR